MSACQLSIWDMGLETKCVAITPKIKSKYRLKKGEIGYQCFDCMDEPIIFHKIIPKMKCEKCGLLMEGIE